MNPSLSVVRLPLILMLAVSFSACQASPRQRPIGMGPVRTRGRQPY